LIGLAVIATVWLGFGNQLVLYIHPRYIVFTLVMAVIALVLVIASTLFPPAEDEQPAVPTRRLQLLGFVAVAAAALLAISMIALPPATLTSATADQRVINSTAVGPEQQSLADVENSSGETFAS